MTISRKLSIIILITIIEVSFTIWAAFEISKGATFHRLNLLHLRYAAQYTDEIAKVEAGEKIVPAAFKKVIGKILEQPADCLEKVNFLDKMIMKSIGTDYALKICQDDLKEGCKVLKSIDNFESQKLDRSGLIISLNEALTSFNDHSDRFEDPITKTVEFILKTMIPMVIFISLFNICFVTYISRTITGSIKAVIKLLSKKNASKNIQMDINNNVSGELLELLNVARRSIKEDLLNIETSNELKEIVAKQTDILVRANEELSQFAYRTSHDLKSPLITIRGFSAAISEDIDAGDYESVKKYAKKIGTNVQKLENLVTDILDLAKADLDNSDKENINLEEIIDGIKERLEKIYIDNDVTINTEIEPSVKLYVSKTRITQILENLISNSLKYCDFEKSNRYVKISLIDTVKIIHLSIEDNGIGIPEKFKDKVFLMFQRFHPKVSSGSGLGMYIVKKHLDHIGAKISLNSSDKGTTFTIQIPKNI